MTTRKQELIEALMAYFLRHGPTDLSLRPMAAAVGTSARLLIFHFGSREKLFADVLDAMQEGLQASFARLRATRSGPRPFLRTFWSWALDDQNFASLRLLYQLHVLAIQNQKRYAPYLRRTSRHWLALIQDALPKSRRTRAFATLCGAVFDGLFLELMSTGDYRRTTMAIELFIRTAGGASHGRPLRGRTHARTPRPSRRAR